MKLVLIINCVQLKFIIHKEKEKMKKDGEEKEIDEKEEEEDEVHLKRVVLYFFSHSYSKIVHFKLVCRSCNNCNNNTN